jgi:hypothetical protein
MRCRFLATYITVLGRAVDLTTAVARSSSHVLLRNTPSTGSPLIRNGKRHEFERVGVQAAQAHAARQ